MKLLLIFCVSLAILTADLSYGQVFKWVDDNGTVHFTDDFLQIPGKYRSKSEKIGVPEGGTEPKEQSEASPAKKKEEPYKDRMGRGEEYWRDKIGFWNKKLATAQDKMETLRQKYNDLTDKYNASKGMGDRATIRNERDQIRSEIDLCKQQVEEARTMLDRKIPEEAELYKAKPEWVRSEKDVTETKKK